MAIVKAVWGSGSVFLAAVAVLLALPAPGAAAQSPVTALVAHFDSLEHVVEQIAENERARSSNLRTTTAFFKKLMARYPEFHDLLRINSRGKVTNEQARDGKVGRRYRSVARQSWFRTVGPGKEPYYGKVRTRRGRYFLFWAVPILLDGRSGGAILAKLDLDECLEGAASRVGGPFRIYYDGRRVFSHEWRGVDDAETARFDINGMEGLSVKYDAAAMQVAAAAPAKKPAPAKKKPAAAKSEAATPAAKSESTPKEAEPVKQTGKDKGKSNVLGLIIFPVLIVIAVVLIIYLYRLVTNAVNAQHERLMRQIDGEGPDVGPASGPPMPPSSSGAHPRHETPPPQNAPSPTPAPAAAPVGVDPMGVTQPIPFPPPGAQRPRSGGGQAQAQTQASRSAPAAGPAGGGGAPISVDDYEKIRDQVRRETVPQIRRELESEFEAKRKEVEKRSEAFGGEITMHLHQLIGKISEMGDDPTGLTNTVAATIHELNATVNRYRSKDS